MGTVDRNFSETFTPSQRIISIREGTLSHFEPVL